MKFRAEKTAAALALGYPGYPEAIAGMYRDGQSMEQIGAAFGVTQIAILYRLRSMGIKARPRGGANNKWGWRGKPQCNPRPTA